MSSEPKHQFEADAEASGFSRAWNTYSRRTVSQLKRDFWLHALALAALFAFILFVVRPYPDVCYISPAGWFQESGALFYFWFPFIWTLVFAVHFFVMSALTVDEEKMVAKSREIRSRSTDFGHMESIMDRQWDGDDSVMSPFDPRRKTDAFGKPKSKPQPKRNDAPDQKDADASDS